MQVIIPLAGRGTRLQPHTFTKPKPLVTCAGKPVLGHILDKLEDVPVEEIIFIVGHLGEQIEQYVEPNYDFPARYVVQEELKGQAHALRLARDCVHSDVLIIFVDTIFEADLARLTAAASDGVIYVKEVDDPRRFGVVVTDDDGHITRFVEKPSTPVSNLAVIGVYYIRDYTALFDAIDELIERDIQTKGEYFLADALQLMVEKGARFEAWPVPVWEDCGTPEALLHSNRYLLENGRANGDAHRYPTSVIVPPVFIHPTARVDSAVIGPYATLAANVEVSNAIIRDSIVDEDSIIRDTILDQSLIGKRAYVAGQHQRVNVGDAASIDFGA